MARESQVTATCQENFRRQLELCGDLGTRVNIPRPPSTIMRYLGDTREKSGDDWA